MRAEKLLGKILRLEGMKVTAFDFVDDPEESEVRELRLWVKPWKTGCRCPTCERRCRIISQGWDERRWTDISALGRRVVLRHRPKEIECPTHGRAQEMIPWAAPHARVTYRNEWRVCTLSKLATQKAAAEVLCMPKSTVSDVLHRVITRVRTGHRIRGLVSLGVDEVSYKKGQKYVTLVYDLDRSKVVWVGEGKGRATLERFFTEVLTKQQREAIRWACSDMASGYTETIKDHCPNATLVIDRFHVVKKLNEAVDAVRKEEWRNLEGDQKNVSHGCLPGPAGPWQASDAKSAAEVVGGGPSALLARHSAGALRASGRALLLHGTQPLLEEIQIADELA